MRAGILTEIISIYKPTVTTNQFGEETTSYTLKTTTRARVVNNNGQRNVNNEITYQYTKTLHIRSYVSIGEYDRILWKSKYYRIIDINEHKKQGYKEIKIETVEND